MDQSLTPEKPDGLPASPSAVALIRKFVEHWGMMARAWGINATMGELFALLYITGDDWTAEDLRSWLKVSRGNVSMNLRELLAWGVVRKSHRAGERRELYRAETDVWTLFRRILTERKRRELDPTLTVLDSLVQLSEDDPELGELRARVEPLRQFFGMIDGLSVRLMALESRDIIELSEILAMDEPAPPDRPKEPGGPV
ncbi:GbsR/MarR family transcriptional regulator [Paludisphaera borealis]|uniref:HTH-type transcriptional regulator n=1 Tax=Paludisphaera borealis TaxID=1387353 RepID=A0A1U7CL38_9BACT|nr:transcriptional regulator [Paludisphaera borealis]APW59641.1 hypothetical protein BSF38_01070 [Paludisphaera borealis]